MDIYKKHNIKKRKTITEAYQNVGKQSQPVKRLGDTYKTVIQYNNVLEESRGVQGFAAELKLFNSLKQFNRLPPDQTQPAGSDSHGPDLSFLDKNNKIHNLEVKFKLPDFGQLELKWEQDRLWHFKDYDKIKQPEKYYIVNALRHSGVEKMINSEWNEPPKRYTIPTRDITWADREHDEQRFKDVRVTVPTNFVEIYYGSKNVDYINIERYGLYHLKNDPAQTGAPKFNPPSVILRMRRKPRSSRFPHKYGFLGALRVKGGLPKSHIDLNNPEDIKNTLF